MRRHGTRLVIIVFVVLAASSSVPVSPALAGMMEPYGMANYCQVPPFVVSNIVPNIMILSSNSASMLYFAYHPPGNMCDNVACSDFVDNVTNYYGYFDSDRWYTTNAGNTQFLRGPLKTETRPANSWDGNFLNWLTMRRIDVLRKAMTGGVVSGGSLSGQKANTTSNGYLKSFDDTAGAYTPWARNVLYTFSTTNNTFSVSKLDSGSPISGSYKVDVEVPAGKQIEGVIQAVIGEKARLGLTFFNPSNHGGHVDPPPGFTSLSSVVNRINTPSNINGGASEPLAEALYTIAGFYAQVADSSALGGLSGTSCLVGSSCDPMYSPGANSDYTVTNNNTDPYNYGSGGIVRYAPCAKSFAVIIADGEPCGDGEIPRSLVDNTPAAYRYTGPTQNWCGLGDNVAGLESVALWAHTTDLRSATVGKNRIDRTQNLTIYVVQAFGSGSGLLRQAAINGAFEDANGSGTPDVQSEWDGNNDGKPDAFYEATQGSELEAKLRELFAGILKRASSGTAASVLASGEGSGANLVQAVFYPRRRFGNDIITWTGSLQNLWYYVDPYLGNAAIHEDTVGDKILALDNDYLARFVYDTTTDTTNVQLFKTDLFGNVDNTVTPVTKSFEKIKSLWEAGGAGTDRTGMLHVRTTGTRTIFTLDNTATYGRREFIAGNYTYLNPLMAVPDLGLPDFGFSANWGETASVIQYVRGTDNVSTARPRTVFVGTDNAASVWKLGDIIHSTPRIAGRTPLNAYYKVYGDTTYKAFTDNASSATSYANRGTVFAGGNDGMLHAFKLGKLEFSGSWQTSFGRKARLANLDGTTPLGYEDWAYIPKNALPYLKYLPDNDYCHLYYVDLSPVIFDASIAGNPDDLKTPASWRTILVGGMGTGGASRAAAGSCNGGTSDCVKAPAGSTGGLSSYFAIDVTDPGTPKVLWEFADDRLGFATTGPAIVKINYTDPVTHEADRTRNGHWYVVLGSGPTGPIDNTYSQFLARSDQELRLFVLDLKTGLLRATINTGISTAFSGSMLNAAADFDLDYQDDALFFGYVKKDSGTGTWTNGGVGRLVTKEDADPTQWVFSKVIDDVGPVTSSVVRLQNNIFGTNWLYFGTGRYYYERGTEIDDADGARTIYGIKDPCFKAGNTYPDCTASPVVPSDLRNVTLIADVNTDESATNASGFAGWFINLASDNTTAIDYGDGAHYYHAEREITDPLSISSTGTVFFTTYRPYNEFCALGGKSFIWAVRYNTGGAPTHALTGKALIQVSTASVEQLDLSAAFSGPNSQGGRRSGAIEGVPPIAQGLSILTAPPPANKILHMIER